MTKLRILIVTSWYPNKSNPVYGTFVREQALALARSGQAEVALFYPSDPEIQSDSTVVNDEGGVRTYRANLRFEGNPLKYLIGGIKAARELKKIIRAFKADIIHVHVSFPAGILTYLATLGMSIPYIITEHMSYLHEYTVKPHYRLLLKKAYEGAVKVLVVSPYLAKQFDGLGWEISPECFPNMVDVERFNINQIIANQTDAIKTNVKKTNADTDSLDNVNILFVGGLDQREVKGMQYLLPALANVITFSSDNNNLNRIKKPHLHIIGDGVKRAVYEQTVRELGIEKQVTFHGTVKPQDMPAFYLQCDFLVLSSLKETFGVVLIEAMACGKPVVATACGGPDSIVTPQTGILVEKESVPALAQGLKTMLNNYQNYSPEMLRRYPEEHYGSSVLAKKLVELYKKSLAPNQTQNTP